MIRLKKIAVYGKSFSEKIDTIYGIVSQVRILILQKMITYEILTFQTLAVRSHQQATRGVTPATALGDPFSN